ncbi:MAG: hypothetical protein R3E95_06740 [Thiolinea sp.]
MSGTAGSQCRFIGAVRSRAGCGQCASAAQSETVSTESLPVVYCVFRRTQNHSRQFFLSRTAALAFQKQQEDESAVISSKAAYTAWQSEIEGIHQAIKQGARKGEDTQELTAKLIRAEQLKPAIRRTPDMLFEDSTPESVLKSWPTLGQVPVCCPQRRA